MSSLIVKAATEARPDTGSSMASDSGNSAAFDGNVAATVRTDAIIASGARAYTGGILASGGSDDGIPVNYYIAAVAAIILGASDSCSIININLFSFFPLCIERVAFKRKGTGDRSLAGIDGQCVNVLPVQLVTGDRFFALA